MIHIRRSAAVTAKLGNMENTKAWFLWPGAEAPWDAMVAEFSYGSVKRLK